jgi:hypothetical protein
MRSSVELSDERKMFFFLREFNLYVYPYAIRSLANNPSSSQLSRKHGTAETKREP